MSSCHLETTFHSFYFSNHSSIYLLLIIVMVDRISKVCYVIVSKVDQKQTEILTHTLRDKKIRRLKTVRRTKTMLNFRQRMRVMARHKENIATDR